jgi:hypothetical protein
MRTPVRRGSCRASRIAAATAITASAVLALSVAAAAKDTSYRGPVFDSTGKVEFHLERDKGNLWVMDFHANGFQYACPDGSAHRANFGIKRMKVRDREFAGYTYFGDFRGSEFAEVEGRLRRHGRARGIVTYQDGFDGIGICKSGDLGWRARR